MIKTILAFIGTLALVAAITIFVMFGGMISKVSTLDSGAMPAYMKMFNTVLETGNAAEAMVLEYKVDKEVNNDEVAESVKALTENHNMRLTGDVKMFTKKDAKPNEVKHARIFSLCSLFIAKKFLNFSHYYGGFMPCRIMLIEMGNGDRFLYTMDLTLMIHGGRTLPPEMLKMAQTVQTAMEDISARSAKGDF